MPESSFLSSEWEEPAWQSLLFYPFVVQYILYYCTYFRQFADLSEWIIDWRYWLMIDWLIRFIRFDSIRFQHSIPFHSIPFAHWWFWWLIRFIRLLMMDWGSNLLRMVWLLLNKPTVYERVYCEHSLVRDYLSRALSKVFRFVKVHVSSRYLLSEIIRSLVVTLQNEVLRPN